MQNMTNNLDYPYITNSVLGWYTKLLSFYERFLEQSSSAPSNTAILPSIRGFKDKMINVVKANSHNIDELRSICIDVMAELSYINFWNRREWQRFNRTEFTIDDYKLWIQPTLLMIENPSGTHEEEFKKVVRFLSREESIAVYSLEERTVIMITLIKELFSLLDTNELPLQLHLLEFFFHRLFVFNETIVGHPFRKSPAYL